MTRTLKIVCVSVALLPPLALAQSAQTVIYKLVDESGRVTYANTPLKGGVRVELEPLTVIPSTPGGSLSQASARAPYTLPIPVATVTPVSKSAVANTPVPAAAPVAVVSPVASAPAVMSAPAPYLAPVATPSQIENKIASLDTGLQQVTAQRLMEARRRVLEGDLQAEEQSLSAAKTKLAEEQRNSGNVRAMRASFSPTAATATPQKPLLTPEQRAEIERHFERVRNLQDEVAMHENNLQGLREQLAGLK